ncbi:hypothetical protein AVEN_112547-1 [Araneus ventricosus]|uniref:Uncharacterized protein n=1 Tax=Araneus ventricosus TaxID=182803 RepID=A0A4Y1ZM48_ARAVE|nr:hypothetical protein AVEN_112547-1 [Araneus ventricosus]
MASTHVMKSLFTLISIAFCERAVLGRAATKSSRLRIWPILLEREVGYPAESGGESGQEDGSADSVLLLAIRPEGELRQRNLHPGTYFFLPISKLPLLGDVSIMGRNSATPSYLLRNFTKRCKL